MKNLAILTLFTLHFSLFTLSASAAVPLKWTVETSRLAPAVFDVVRGETIALEAAFNSSGKPFAMDGEPVSIFWQTNGMGTAWWTATAVATSNLVRATFTPEMDPGAATVNGFLGSSGSIYRAAFTFRFRHGPGAVPNTLPLPVPVIDFAKVKVLNPPWSGGGGGGVDTNAVIDIIHRTVDGAARPLPKYLHLYEAYDSYPEVAAEYYRSRGNGKADGGCSAVRDGGFLYRNFDYPFDDRAEFVVHMSSGPARFASVGVAQVGTNLTEQIVTSGKWSKWYKALPGATVDGINENGVVAEINVVDGEVDPDEWAGSGDLHPLAAVRWVLDNATNALHAAQYLKDNIKFPQGWTQNFHWMIADTTDTYIVENGDYHKVTGRAVMTNFPLYPSAVFGSGWERYVLLTNQTANITNAWFTRAYAADTEWLSEFDSVAEMETAKEYWRNGSKESHRGQHVGNKWWWQSVHTSVYDLKARTLKIAVQETDDWYTFQVPSSGANVDLSPIEAQIAALQSGKLDKTGGTITGDVKFEGNVEVLNGARTINVWGSPIRSGGTGFGWLQDDDGNTVQKGLDEKQDNITASGVLKGDGSGVVVAATPSSHNTTGDYRAPTDNEAHEDSVVYDFSEQAARGGDWSRYTWRVDYYSWLGKARLRNNAEDLAAESVETFATQQDFDNASVFTWGTAEFPEMFPIEGTKTYIRRCATTGESFVTHSFVTNAAQSAAAAAVSTNNPAFVSAVRSIAQPSSPSLRVYDEIRQCWWIGRMVNGVINWEVE